MEKHNKINKTILGIFTPRVIILIGLSFTIVGAYLLKNNIITAVGAVVSAFGGFWAAINSEKYENKLTEKNDYILANITGGDSFPFLEISNINHIKNTAVLSSHSEGKFPLYDVSFTVIDNDQNFDNINIDNLSMFQKVYNEGNISPKTARMLEKIDLGKGDKRSFSVQSVARNGSFFQTIVIKRINGEWKRAISVTTLKNNKSVLLLEKSSEGFPKNKDGSIKYK